MCLYAPQVGCIENEKKRFGNIWITGNPKNKVVEIKGRYIS